MQDGTSALMDRNVDVRITCVHQGYELYGSDRAFAESVKTIRNAYPDAVIEVVLPRAGGIVDLLRDAASHIVFEPIWVLRRRDLWRLATVGMLRLPAALARAVRRYRDSDLVYINTSVITDYTLAARFFPGKTVLHIHEIPEGATLRVLRGLALWSGAEVIFNSKATREAFALPAATRSHVIYNGLAGPAVPEPVSYDGRRPLRVLMLGRISRMKGQEVLVEALRLMAESLERLEVRIVGSAFEDEAKEHALRDLVREAGLDGTIAMMPFTAKPEVELRWADVVVVPSRRPEPLGRVAIEAMAFGRPPIVSAIGGLREIVEHGRSGWLVPPNQPEALAETLRGIIAAPEALHRMAAPARARYEALFGEKAAEEAITAVLAGLLGPLPRTGNPPHPGATLRGFA